MKKVILALFLVIGFANAFEITTNHHHYMGDGCHRHCDNSGCYHY